MGIRYVLFYVYSSTFGAFLVCKLYTLLIAPKFYFFIFNNPTYEKRLLVLVWLDKGRWISQKKKLEKFLFSFFLYKKNAMGDVLKFLAKIGNWIYN